MTTAARRLPRSLSTLDARSHAGRGSSDVSGGFRALIPVARVAASACRSSAWTPASRTAESRGNEIQKSFRADAPTRTRRRADARGITRDEIIPARGRAFDASRHRARRAMRVGSDRVNKMIFASEWSWMR